MQPWYARMFVFFAIALAGADRSPAGDSYVSFVPWKLLQPSDEPAHEKLILYWIPATREELRRSELLTSRELMQASTQCVAMQVIRPDDDDRMHALDVDELPAAILVDEEGHELGRVEEDDGALNANDVESIVRDALDARLSAAEAMLDEAQSKLDGGDVAAAVALYERVWDERCACPRQANEAKRALKKLKR